MAEQEVAKHTKKMYKIWSGSDHGWWHKFKEFLVEVAIIVFAVSVSIWFHNMSEKSHDRADARAYLAGIRGDLLKDITEMRADSGFLSEQMFFFNKLATNAAAVDTTEIKEKSFCFISEIVLVPNVSRFEALKYSGKINIIENKELLDELLNLYEEKIPVLVNFCRELNHTKNQSIGGYCSAHSMNAYRPTPAFINAVKTDPVLRYSFEIMGQNSQWVIQTYHQLIEHNQKLLRLIEEEIE